MAVASDALLTVERAIKLAEFRAALREFESRSESVVRELGLTPRWYLLLLFIKGAPDGSERLTMSDLTERMRLSPNTVTELVTRVEAAGLVARDRATHDLRIVFVNLTHEGERRLAAAALENDEYRRELGRRFDALQIAFRAAVRR